MIRPLFLALALLLLSDVAAAQACIVQGDGDCMLEPNAAQGQDVSPYCFQPTLSRGQEETNYAFTANDPNGVCHHFDTYLRFELPSNLLDPGETVTTARLLLYFAFSFAYEGPHPMPPFEPPITVNVHEVVSPWNEDLVTWMSRPPYAAQISGTSSNITTLGVKEFIVTDLVRAWADGTKQNHGFAVISPTAVPFGMFSWEADSSVPSFRKARLRITVGPGAPAAPIPLFPY